MLISALATGAPQPAGAAAGCTAHTTGLRYLATVTWSCGGTVASAAAVVTRVSTHATVASDAIEGVGTQSLSLGLHGDLASGATYSVTLTYDDGNGATVARTTWRTLPAPAHPGLHVRFITAIPAAAVLDIAHRMDLANLFAVPRPSDFVDASTRTLTVSQFTAALRGHQSALVVTDEALLGRAALATALARYCNQGHGVVLGGQTHWLEGREGWTHASSVGGATSVFASKWAMFAYDDIFPDQASSAPHQLATSSIQPNFLTKGLRHFTVVGPGSGEAVIQDYFSGRVLATLQKASSPSSPFHSFGQVFLAARQIGAGRVADLGFRPWSSAVASGGFDPSQSPGGALTARSLWWAMNRIPPTDTHFTVKPSNPSDRATVTFALGAKDQDPENVNDLRYRYRVDHGAWHWAVGNSFALYHLAGGSVHTVYGRAVDSGGNVDAHIAHYTFRVSPGALG